jgi:hypothetical protein
LASIEHDGMSRGYATEKRNVLENENQIPH